MHFINPAYKEVLSYLANGKEVPPDLVIPKLFNVLLQSDNFFIIIWLLSIDVNIPIPKRYILQIIRIGVKLGHIGGIKTFLSKLPDVQLCIIGSCCGILLHQQADKLTILLDYISTNINELSKE
jgi:hypothetical protein